MCSSSRPKAPTQKLPPPPPPPPELTAQAPIIQDQLKRRGSKRSGVGALMIQPNLTPYSQSSGLAIPTGV